MRHTKPPYALVLILLLLPGALASTLNATSDGIVIEPASPQVYQGESITLDVTLPFADGQGSFLLSHLLSGGSSVEDASHPVVYHPAKADADLLAGKPLPIILLIPETWMPGTYNLTLRATAVNGMKTEVSVPLRVLDSVSMMFLEEDSIANQEALSQSFWTVFGVSMATLIIVIYFSYKIYID